MVQNNFSGDDRTTTVSWVPTSANTDANEIARFNIHAQELNNVDFDYDHYESLSFGRVALPVSNNFLNQNKIISCIKNSNYADIRINFNESSSSINNSIDTFPPSLRAPFIVGKFRNSDAYFFNGYIAEIIIFNRALNDKERYQIEKYLSEKWGIKIG